MLHKQHLRGTRLKTVVLLRVLALLATEGRIGQDHVEGSGCLLKKRIVGGRARQGVAVPEVGLVNAVQHQSGQRDGEHQVLLFAAEEGVVLQSRQIGGTDYLETMD